MNPIDVQAKQTYDKYNVDPTSTDFSFLIPASPFERKLCLYYIAHQKRIDWDLRNKIYCPFCKAYYEKSYIKKHNNSKKHKDAEIRSECRI